MSAESVTIVLPPEERERKYELLPIDKATLERLNKLIRLYTVILANHGDRSSTLFLGSQIEARCSTLQKVGYTESLISLSSASDGRAINSEKNLQHHKIDTETSAHYGGLAGYFCLYFTYVAGFHPGNRSDEFGTEYLGEFIRVIGGGTDSLPRTTSELLERFQSGRKAEAKKVLDHTRPKAIAILRYIFTQEDKISDKITTGRPEPIDEKCIEDMIHLGVILEPDRDPSDETRDLIRRFVSKHKKWIRRSPDLQKYLEYHFPTLEEFRKSATKSAKQVSRQIPRQVETALTENRAPNASIEGEYIHIENVSSIIDPSIKAGSTTRLASTIPGMKRKKDRIRFPVSSLGLSRATSHRIQIRCGEVDLDLDIPPSVNTPNIRENMMRIVENGGTLACQKLFKEGEFTRDLQVIMKMGEVELAFGYDDIINFGDLEPGAWEMSYRSVGGESPDSAPISIDVGFGKWLMQIPKIRDDIRQTVLAREGKVSAKELFDSPPENDRIWVVFRHGNIEKVYALNSEVNLMDLPVGKYTVHYRDALGRQGISPGIEIQVGISVVATIDLVKNPTLVSTSSKMGSEAVTIVGANQQEGKEIGDTQHSQLERLISRGEFALRVENFSASKVTCSLTIAGIEIPLGILPNGKIRVVGGFSQLVLRHKKMILAKYRALDLRSHVEELKLRERSRVMEKLSGALNHIHRVSELFGDGSTESFGDSFGKYIIKPGDGRVLYVGSYVLAPDILDEGGSRRYINPLGNERDAFLSALTEVGLRYKISRLEKPIGHISISLSLPGERCISGVIETTVAFPHYKIRIDPLCDEIVAKHLSSLLLECIQILGYLWYRVYGQKKRKIIGERHTSVQILDNPHDVHVEIMRANFNRTIGNVKSMFKSGRGKVAGTPTYIGGYKNHAIYTVTDRDYLKNGPDQANIILIDERISSVPDSHRGAPEVYALIALIPRLQKYLIKRILATLKKIEQKGEEISGILTEDIDGKSEFTGSMYTVFLLFWARLSDTEKSGFIMEAKKSATNGLNYTLSSGNNIIADLLDSWKKNDVQLRYINPGTMRLKDVRMLLASSRRHSLTQLEVIA